MSYIILTTQNQEISCEQILGPRRNLHAAWHWLNHSREVEEFSKVDSMYFNRGTKTFPKFPTLHWGHERVTWLSHLISLDLLGSPFQRPCTSPCSRLTPSIKLPQGVAVRISDRALTTLTNCFVNFPSPSRKTPGWYLGLGHDRLIPHHFEFIIHYCSIMRF
jgi:hypothetical protein